MKKKLDRLAKDTIEYIQSNQPNQQSISQKFRDTFHHVLISCRYDTQMILVEYFLQRLQQESLSTKSINNCPNCGLELETNYEYLQEHYGETPTKMLTPDMIILWCENCKNAFNGFGEEV